MSRIGKQPIPVPDGVKVEIGKTEVKVTGPHGAVSARLHPALTVEWTEDGKVLEVRRPSDSKQHKALHGLTRSLVAAAVQGVKEPYRKALEIVGVGYTAKLAGKTLTLQIGFCHPVMFEVPDDLTVEAPTTQRINISGCDKQRVGQFAAIIRKEPNRPGQSSAISPI